MTPLGSNSYTILIFISPVPGGVSIINKSKSPQWVFLNKWLIKEETIGPLRIDFYWF